MDRVTKVKKHLKREPWKILIKECQSSGMTNTTWCRQNDICEQTYYRNLKILREEICDSLLVSIPESKKACCVQKVGSPIAGSKHSGSCNYSSSICIIRNSEWCNATNNRGSAACIEKHMLGDITVAKDIYVACGLFS